MREQRAALSTGALLVALGIVLGAFGVHGLREVLSTEALGWWQTGVEYQLWNAVGLVGLAAAPVARPRLAAVLIATGVLVFSGSLYLMALTDARWLGAVTPIGGLLMILGWAWVAWQALRTERQ